MSQEATPRMIGNASCATATCHGGPIGSPVAWHSSSQVWLSHDPHSRAGEILLNEESRRIVMSLEPNATAVEKWTNVLQERCVSCHAPQERSSSSGSTSDLLPANEFRQSLVAGVSCEACHGPASVWEKPHRRQDWAGPSRFTPRTGMRDTESLLTRAETCARCHVGSRVEDGLARDVNHDLIAAGHPPLCFDLLRYQTQLPPHWNVDLGSVMNIPPERLSASAEATQLQVLAAAARLSTQRQRAAEHLPLPEFAEYACVSCHHKLEINGPLSDRERFEIASWQPWYTAAIDLGVRRQELVLSNRNLHEVIADLDAILTRQAAARLAMPTDDPLVHLKNFLAKPAPNHLSDHYAAGAWLNRLQTLVAAAANQLDKPSRDRIESSTTLFGTNTLGYAQRAPRALDLLLPAAWRQRDIDALRKELIRSVAPR